MLLSRKWILNLTLVAALTAIAGASIGAQATATICKDGTTSASSGRGACSGHGGVDKIAVKQQKKAVKTQVKAAKSVANHTAGAQVTTLCVDGTTSNSTGRGTCSGHGGAKGAEVTSKATGAPIPAPSTAAAPRASVPVTIPRPSASARTRASTNSAIVAGSGATEDNNPAGAIARCRDGLYSHAQHRRGACGHHGGVATWM